MKKAILYCLVFVLALFSIAGCAGKNDTPNTQALSPNASETPAEAGDISFEQYISGCASNATEEDLKKLSVEFDNIKKEHATGSITEQAFTVKMYDFDDKLRDAGMYMPYKSLAAYTYAIKTMSEEDRLFVEKNYDAFMAAYSQADSEESILNIYQQGKEIYKKYNLNLEELISSIQGATYNFAIFKVDGNMIALDAERNSTLIKIDDATKEKYIDLCKQIQSIVPEDIWERVSSFLVFASGRTSSFAQFEDLERKNFRIGIDITSMLDQSGNLAKEQREVIVHETAHIITLNDTQASSKPAETRYENANAEFLDRYQSDSYLYQFFTKFWTGIYEEYYNTADASGFYSKYKDQFVSDYAAVAPEEDIAESFRYFVINDKPTSDSIRDQKVRFFYEYDEFVKWREEIRDALQTQ